MAGPAEPPALESELLQYLETCYATDEALSLLAVQHLLDSMQQQNTPCSWQLRSEDGLPLLHLAVMNEATEPQEMAAVVTQLLARGAPPDAKDEDGDTALMAVMQLAADAEQDGPPDEEEAELLQSAKLANMAAVRALLRWPGVALSNDTLLSVAAWLRRYMPKDGREDVIADMEARAGKAATTMAWASEELLEYLETQGYEAKKGVKAKKVKAFMDMGAVPRHKQNGASALLLVVLNPYSTLPELMATFHMMLSADPSVALMQDGFKLTPLQWASDYVNVAQQHCLPRANPAPLLALLPCVLSLLPPDMDAGEVCLRVAPDGASAAQPPRGAPQTRFMEGHRVRCRISTPGGGCDWEEGVVIGLWYREPCWPPEHFGAPYEVQLDIGLKVFALAEHEKIIRAEEKAVPEKAAVSPEKGGRFRKRQTKGGWEMLDTVSGKARSCSPPSSDDED